MNDLDAEALSRELVRALRGSRSQVALSRRLRYESNVVYLWESGRRYPTPAGFFLLCQRTGVDVNGVLDTLWPERPHDGAPWTVEGAARFLDHVRGDRSAAELARSLGISRHTVARWLRGDTEARLPELFRLIDGCSKRLLDLVQALADPSLLPSMETRWRQARAAEALVREQPWAPAVQLALELAAYKALPAHEEGWLAARLGIDPATEAACLSLLAEAGQIAFDGERWSPVATPAVYVRHEEGRDLRGFWAGVAAERIDAASDRIVQWNLFTVSAADLERLKGLQRAYYRSLREIVAESTPEEHLVLAHLQMLRLDEAE